ncbi:maleylpyruvate isomerase family mycothiol-dependent enzyme [Nocardioides sp. zg-1228]|uniref:maleylpyruvate isomerase family mycothiol-dependent enzyme n=1 Tax=Nocardioides sp. zg-1228 TaxID=2763008 RepID=UPI001642D2CA|nr:maleylpyruvate isomerase family mycothiol-dependent enzyme [Nocardioides sp. zg-1228]MBC2935026.1 maleylpyruvate isomerase family mycothiol-dependent enzyme [Nocardioides sp. zg-1228]QSF56196.1 maleylpyruvate isomerase family mycothiol-dependent enzyme [Nocardioides sp. zg-1228]
MIDLPRPGPDTVARADRALGRTVEALAGAQYAEASRLPGWTRSHVLAHLALNAEGLAGVLHGARTGRPQPMYASPQARDADIDDLASTGPEELRERLAASTARFGEALTAMRPDDWDGRFERTPGGPGFALRNAVLMRLREVEIHHADLGTGYTADDWPEDFRAMLLESMTKRAYPQPFAVRPTDLGHTWRYGSPGEAADQVPVVSGTSGALGWWLTGRGSGEGLTSDSDELPKVDPW